MQPTNYTQTFLAGVQQIAKGVDASQIDRIVELLRDTRSRGGRVFFLGVGGGAGHAGHAVNDFRKLAGIESYAPTDNVSELTARINDEGWSSCYANWLRGSRLRSDDTLFVFSVGGGCLEKNISANIVESLRLGVRTGATIVGVVGRDGGYTAQVAHACVIVPTISADTVTPHTESFQAVIWHLIVTHPRLKLNGMKWEEASLMSAEQSFSIAMA
jgi:D-sedoheptulose 7-phosphate isomerase